MSAVKRLRMELDVWQAAWKQLEAFLDRVDDAAGQDEPHAKVVCALLPVFGVIERARKRARGVALSPPLACAPRGAGLGSVGVGTLGGADSRVPGVEELEFAVAGIASDNDGKLTNDAELAGTTTLFAFRDEKHGGDVQVRAPTYDFGPLASNGSVTGVVDAGLFSRDQRKDATLNGNIAMKTWQKLRDERVAKLPSPSATAQPLSSTLDALHSYSKKTDLTAVANGAAALRDECKADKDTLSSAVKPLDEEGASTVVDAINQATNALQTQMDRYDAVAKGLTGAALASLTEAQLVQLKATLHLADAPDVAGHPPKAIEDLDAAAASAMNDEVNARLAYPDGPLRMLRALEWALRFQWVFRLNWFKVRNQVSLKPLLKRVLSVFTDNLSRLLSKQPTGFPLALAVAKDTATQATTLSVTSSADLTNVKPGQLAVIGGDRPALAIVLGWEAKGGSKPERRLKISALNASIATGAKLPGVAGMVQLGAPVNAGPVSFTADELLTGNASAGPQANGLVQEVIALASRMALVLGKDTHPLGLAPPVVAAPYPSVTFDVLEPVEVGATRLFLQSAPPASASGSTKSVPVARPGELLLIRGADEEGTWWQSVVQVDSVDVRSAASAKDDDAATGTPVPPCCEDDDEIVVITLRDMQLPKSLVRNVTLRRDFKGFGGPSLATGVVLPIEVDPDTATLTEPDSGKNQVVLRDPELRAAVSILKTWVGGET